MVKLALSIFLISLCIFPCETKDLSITVVYNNIPYDKNLDTGWGISLFIKGLDKNILFDTGGNGGILLSNMAKLNIKPKDIDIVFLSHIHSDHTGGLWAILAKNTEIYVYLPASFPKEFKDKVAEVAKKVVSVDKPVKICENVFSTGELGNLIKEQALVIERGERAIVITGCAHPGIVKIVKFVKEHFKKDIYLVLGGFHLMGYNEEEIKEIIKDLKNLGVKKVVPSHCTGAQPIELFREAWGKDFIDLGCGARIEVR